VDGAVILALVHGGTLGGKHSNSSGVATSAVPPTSVAVAETVAAYNVAFCDAYSINRADTSKGIPGVLYGRYMADQYGGGNPWVLITAALASLFYRAAQFVASTGSLPSGDALQAWRTALAAPTFSGSAVDFVAAGDSVMHRLKLHVGLPTGGAPGFMQMSGETGHLYEQLDRNSGFQYNAKDLTWSYAETLDAAARRSAAIACMK
jgi:glucoamylase